MTAVETTDRCRALLRAAFPALPAREVRFLAEGWDSTVFEVDGALVFRFPKRAEVDAALQREVRLLPALARALPLPIPAPALVSGPVLDYPWHVVGYPKLPGAPLSGMPLSDRVVAALAPALGHFLRALHAFPAERALALGLPRRSPEEELARLRALWQRARPVVEARLVPATASAWAAWWARLLADPPFAPGDYAPSLIHGDLALEHVLVDEGAAHVTGVIDFGDAAVADPALDLAGLPAPLARAVLVHAGPLPGRRVWERRAAHRAAAPLHAIEAGLRLGRPDLVDEGLDQIRRRWAPRDAGSGG